MNYISNYIIKKILKDSSQNTDTQGKLILINYDKHIIMEILKYFKDNDNQKIIIMLDYKYNINILPKNTINVTSTDMAKARNIENGSINGLNVKSNSYIIFITTEIIDTFSDITSITYDDLKNEFNDIIEESNFNNPEKNKLKKVIKSFIKNINELSVIELESFLKSIYKLMNEEGYIIEEAMGLSLNKLNSFKYKKAFEVLKKSKYSQKDIRKIIEKYKKSKNALLKRVGNKTIDNTYLIEKYDENKDDFESLNSYKNNLILEFINANIKELLEKKSKFIELDWIDDSIYRLFEKIKSDTSKKLGKDTIDAIEEDDIKLDDKDKEILLNYDSAKPKDRKNLIEWMYEIYQKNKLSIEKNSSLNRKWDKLLYPSQVKSDNFILALLETINKIIPDNKIKKIEVSLNKNQVASILKTYNKHAIDYLNKRYSILNSVSDLIEFKFNFIKNIENELEKDKKRRKPKKNIKDYRKGSFSKKKNELHFIVKVLKVNENNPINELKFIWQFNSNTLLTGFKDDVDTIIHHINTYNNLFSNTLYRNTNSEKGDKKPLSILDYSSLESGRKLLWKGKEKYKNEYSVKNILISAKEILNNEKYKELDKIFEDYLNKYKMLLESLDISQNLEKNKFDFTKIEEFSKIYTRLSNFLFNNLDDDRLKEEVIEPFLSLVTFKIGNDNLALIPSYHPLRLISYFVKIKHTFNFLDKYITNEVKVIKKDLFFKDLIQNFKTVYYPEIFRLFNKAQKVNNLLYISESYYDYTILESYKQLKNEQTINPSSQTKILSKIIKNYLDLYPHKQDSLKIVLHAVKNYNFPIKLMKELSTFKNKNIEIYLNDADAEYIRKMYRTFLINSDDILEFNELSFLSNIRLNAFDEDFKQLNELNDQINITFLNDFISTKAELEFMPQILSKSYNLFDYHPTIWSKRKYITNKESGVGIYLISPGKMDLTSSFYNLIYSTMSPLSNKYKDKLPTLNIDRNNRGLLYNLEVIHNKSDWVVNLDTLLDKKIVKEFGANVIKYRKARHINRNLVISSKADTKLLNYRLKSKIKSFFDINDDNIMDNLIKKIIHSMNNLSGDILLKAIGQGKYTNELLGLVLVKAIIESSNNYDNILIYIDDYADWFLSSRKSDEDLLSLESNHLSDILSITPIFDNDNLTTVYIDIVESKFCEKSSKSELAQKSLKQTITTYELINKIFDSNSNYLDKQFWIAKISDLIVETYGKTFQNGKNSEEIRNMIRFNNNIKYIVRGISYVFIYDHPETTSIKKYNNNIFQHIVGSKMIINIFKKLPILDLKEINIESLKYNKVISNSSKEKEREKKETITKKSDVNNIKIQQENNNINNLTTIKENNEFKIIKDATIEVVRHHGYRAKIIAHTFTPNSLRISLKPELGWKTKIFEKMKDDFLSVKELELLRVEVVKGAYDLIFKRKKREIVHYNDCLNNRKLSSDFGNTKILIGRNEENNEVIYYDLDSEFPHALIGGMTKSGKSVLLNIFIIELITTNSINELKLVLVDPKQVEFTRYENIPYLDNDGIITEQEFAIQKLNNIVEEMEYRYQLFKNNKVNNIQKFNKISNKKLPRIVIIFDEFADWMLDEEFKKNILQAISRLAGKARAAGIHLIISTQRPDNKVVPEILRANLGAKFALKVDTDKNSRIILDEEGAENLLGYGHMIVKLPGEKLHVQSAFISDEYINKILSQTLNFPNEPKT